MQQKNVEEKKTKTIQLQNIKTQLKKWWLLPTMSVLIIVPMVLVLTLPTTNVKSTGNAKIIGNIYTYDPLKAEEFETTVVRYSQIQQQWISSVTKTVDVYLNSEEWNSLQAETFAINSTAVKTKIINNLSSNLRLIGLIDVGKKIDVENSEILPLEVSPFAENENQIKFNATLKYGVGDEVSFLPIGGQLTRSQELTVPLKVIDNQTMPALLKKLNSDNALKSSINWNYYGYWYGMNTIGEKDENGKWIGSQKIDVREFNKLALGWFLDTLKKTNLVDANVEFNANELHFYVNGWNKNKLYLKDKEGIEVNSDYVTLSASNQPLNNDNKPASIVSSIEFGWKNPLNDELTIVDSIGSYLLSPVWEYYVYQ